MADPSPLPVSPSGLLFTDRLTKYRNAAVGAPILRLDVPLRPLQASSIQCVQALTLGRASSIPTA
eukprot:CAMPEP_0184492278 /NCGR_PEP_ID=MMETSP0113_2-20130426/22760_1 /TAXON_ID=91329 /ORGANISM="Norrisiella sphaerica, Strain BC52" /LENGTH=64 /DNA_ID=CAMNT_0026876981 /DNA_START=14 /DNA_END=208 /DNA_ORIENTATION=-